MNFDGPLCYDAFITYSQAADRAVAGVLHRRLEQFSKSLFQLRCLHIFRDTSGLSAGEGLWDRLKAALEQSRYLIILASPESGKAESWTDRETKYWLNQGNPLSRLLIVQTGGQLTWDDKNNDFDWALTDNLPPCLKGRFQSAPLWIDLTWAKNSSDKTAWHKDQRFTECIAKLSSTIQGKPLESVFSEALREQRRFRNGAISVVLLLLGLLIAAVTAGWLAQHSRNSAEHLISENMDDLRPKLMAYGQVRLLEETVGAVRSYYQSVPRITANRQTRVNEAKALFAQGEVYRALTRSREARHAYQVAVEILERLSRSSRVEERGEVAVAWAEALTSMALLHHLDPGSGSPVENLRKAYSIIQSAQLPEKEATERGTRILISLAECYVAGLSLNRDDALRYLQTAEELIESQEDEPYSPNLLISLAEVHFFTARVLSLHTSIDNQAGDKAIDRAIYYYQSALRKIEQGRDGGIIGDSVASYRLEALINVELARFYSDLGNTRIARNHFDFAVAAADNVFRLRPSDDAVLVEIITLLIEGRSIRMLTLFETGKSLILTHEATKDYHARNKNLPEARYFYATSMFYLAEFRLNALSSNAGEYEYQEQINRFAEARRILSTLTDESALYRFSEDPLSLIEKIDDATRNAKALYRSGLKFKESK